MFRHVTTLKLAGDVLGAVACTNAEVIVVFESLATAPVKISMETQGSTEQSVEFDPIPFAPKHKLPVVVRSANGKWLACAYAMPSDEETAIPISAVAVYDTTTGKVHHVFTQDLIGTVVSMTFAYRDNILVVGTNGPTKIHYWRITDGVKRNVLEGVLPHDDPDSINTLAVHPTGERLIGGFEHKPLRLFGVGSGAYDRAVDVIMHENKMVQSFTASIGILSPQVFATSSSFGFVNIWDASTFEIIMSIPHPNRSDVEFVAVSGNGKVLASATKDHIVYLWNTADWTLMGQTTSYDQEFTCLTFAPEGARLIVGVGKEMFVWDME